MATAGGAACMGAGQHKNQKIHSATLLKKQSGILRQALGDQLKDFDDFLQLRSYADEAAVPTLRLILEKYIGTGSIYKYAAAQILFFIGTESSHQVLNKFLFMDNYDIRQSLRYIFHWDMKQPQRDCFIEQYHVQTKASKLQIALAVTKKDSRAYKFSITLTNTSSKPLRLTPHDVYLGDMLIFQDAVGHFCSSDITAHYGLPPPTAKSYPELLPNGRWKYEIEGEVKRGDGGSKRACDPARGSMVFSSNDYMHCLSKPGRYRVYTIYQITPGFEASAKSLGVFGIWHGRLASKPIEVEIPSI